MNPLLAGVTLVIDQALFGLRQSQDLKMSATKLGLRFNISYHSWQNNRASPYQTSHDGSNI